jgi:outer membrane protein assembly factor BamB
MTQGAEGMGDVRRRLIGVWAFGLAVAMAPVASAAPLSAEPRVAARPPSPASARQADGTAPWQMFGFDALHSSANAAAVSVTPSNAGALRPAWEYTTPPSAPGQPAGGFDGSPAVADGMVFIGSLSGIFYALREDSGTVAWSFNAGFKAKYTCAALGIADTPTVAVDPATGTPTVYFAGGNGTLWALDAATGAVRWHAAVYPPQKSSADFVWGSPLVNGGTVYIGLASECDNPLSRDGVAAFNQSSGGHLATLWTVPAGSIGGAVWSTPAASTAGVFVTTGNGNETVPGTQGLSNSLVLLNGKTLKVKSAWTMPGIATLDDDFGSSPTLFTATINGVSTPMVGACDKNGYFYALRQTDLAAGPVWSAQLGTPAAQPNNACLATATWDGAHLFITANTSTVGSSTYPAVARELDPATGTTLWATGLADGPVLGGTALDGAGVLAAASYSKTSPSTSNQLVLIDAASGSVVGSYPTTSFAGGEPVFADGYLFFAGIDGTVHALTP